MKLLKSEDATAEVLQVTFRHVNGTVRRGPLQELKVFDKASEWSSFAGTIEYRNIFRVEDSTARLWLDLGHLRDVSELEINGRIIGAK